MIDVPINYWAILVAAIVNMAVGMVWYAPPVFGALQMKVLGLHDGDKGAKKDMWKTYGFSAVSSLVLSYILAHFVGYVGAQTVLDGFQAAFWIWLGFVVTTNAASVVYERRPFQAYLINMGFKLVSLAIMGAILAEWV